MDSRMDKQTDRRMDKQMNSRMDKRMDKQTDRRMDKQMNSRMDKQMDRLIQRVEPNFLTFLTFFAQRKGMGWHLQNYLRTFYDRTSYDLNWGEGCLMIRVTRTFDVKLVWLRSPNLKRP